MKSKLLSRLLPLCLAAAFVAGCDDLTGTGVGTDVYGVDVRDPQGNTLAAVSSLRIVSGSLSVADGGTRQIRVSLRDQGGNVLQLGEGERIVVTPTNSVLLGWDAGTESGGVLSGSLVGREPGTTSIRVGFLVGSLIMYESPSIPVTVN